MKKVKEILNEEVSKLRLVDYLILGIIILVYSFLSFYKLGSFENPQTYYRFDPHEELIIKFDKEDDLIKMKYFTGNLKSIYNIYLSEDGDKYTYAGSTKSEDAFKWCEKSILKKTQYVKIQAENEAVLGELAFYNNSKELIKIDKVLSKSRKEIKNLFDESIYVPERRSYYNSTYFDEIYFARTAYEYTTNEKAYEWTHPPLGKIIQSIPLFVTGKFTPFNYRLMGNISGILMLPVMYMFGKLLFKQRKYAIFAALLMMFDNFHFVQTRMATVDSHLVLFIILSFYFMFKYTKENKDNKNLLLSGLFFGLATSVKWTGMYAGLGLAIIYFVDFFRKKKDFKTLVGRGFLYFVFIPLILYISFYFIFPKPHQVENLKDFVWMQGEMYKYHSQLTASHPFSSPWYSWPVMYKPMWYHQQGIDGTTYETIVGIGNPAIWWLGIIAVLYLVFRIYKKQSDKDIYLLVAVLSLWLPYLFIGRVMFIYHFFPVTPFLMLALTNMFKDINKKLKNDCLMYIYLFVVVITFFIYYPVVTGLPVSYKYVNTIKLFKSWYF